MSQMNVDKLSLYGPLSATPSYSRQIATGAAGAFDEHLEWASKASTGTPSESRASKARTTHSESERNNPSATSKTSEAETNAAQPAEPHENREDDRQSADSDSSSSDPSQERAAGGSKAADDGDSDDATEKAKEETDAEVAAAEVAAVIAVNDAVVATACDEAAQESADSEQAVPVAEAAGNEPKTDAETPAEQADAATEVEQLTPSGDGDEPYQAEASDGNAQTEGTVVGDETTPVSKESSTGNGRRATKSSSRDPASRSVEPIDAAATEAADAGAADALAAKEKHPAVNRHAGSEADAAAIRAAAAAAEGASDSAKPDSDTSSAGDQSGKVNALKPASSNTLQSAASESQKALQSGQVDRVQFVQRVARAFEAASARGGDIRLRLHPPELGSLQLELKVQNGAMTAKLHAESTDARNLLLDNLPALRDRLAQQDIKIQQFEVDLGLGSSGNSPQGSFDQQQWQDTSGQARSATSGSRTTGGDAPAASVTRRTISDSSQFDVTV